MGRGVSRAVTFALLSITAALLFLGLEVGRIGAALERRDYEGRQDDEP